MGEITTQLSGEKLPFASDMIFISKKRSYCLLCAEYNLDRQMNELNFL